VIPSAFACEFASSGTWVIFGYGILVFLGGCRHLDGLEVAEEFVARVVLIHGHLLVICEGCCAFSGGAPKQL
jgi:hypothetical protein